MKLKKRILLALVLLTFAGAAYAWPPYQDCGQAWWDPGWFCNIA